MRLVSPAFDAEVSATTVGDRLEVNAWRGGILLEQALPVTGWALSWDAARQVQGQATITVADPDGRLAPWGLSDALGPGGSRLQVTWVSGLTGTRVPLGWWRIREADPDETWRVINTRTPSAAPGAVTQNNFAQNPRAVASGAVTTATNNPAAWTVTRGVACPATPNGTVTADRVTPLAGGSGQIASVYNVDGLANGGGARATSLLLRTNVAAEVRVMSAGAWTPVPANTWTAVAMAVPVSTYTVVEVRRAGAAAITGTEVAYLTDVQTYVGAFFDGSTPDTPQALYDWTGTPNASTSTQRAVLVTYATLSVRVAGGGSVTVKADEETATVALNRLDAEVVTASTCVAEVRRLLADIGPVTVLAGVTDGPVPAAMVYGDSRADAVDDLLASIQAAMRMGPDGSFEVLPVAGVGPVWTVAGGQDGVLITTVRSLSDTGVYNAATSTGETASGQPLVGRAQRLGGPLAWGGPYGKVPIFHKAVAQTSAGVQADAVTTLDTLTTAGEVDLAVACLAHPGIQPHDRVTIVAPTRAGDAPLTGRVVGVALRSSDGATPAKAMDMTVRVSTDALEAVAGRVARSHV